MTGFTKLVPEIIQSSIWNESSDIRIVWITMLAVKDKDGYVRGDAATLARLANVPKEVAVEALEKFQAPDEGSHTPDNDGRRVVKSDGGWIILNHHLYRSKDRSEYMRKYMREYREKVSVNSVNNVNTYVNLPSVSVSVSDSDSSPEGECEGMKGDDTAPPEYGTCLTTPQPDSTIPDLVAMIQGSRHDWKVIQPARWESVLTLTPDKRKRVNAVILLIENWGDPTNDKLSSPVAVLRKYINGEHPADKRRKRDPNELL